MNQQANKDASFEEKEVDVKYMANRAGNFYNKMLYSIYRLLRFVKKRWYVFLVLIAVGVGLGIYMNASKSSRLRHELIVVPNFGSIDYLNQKIKDYDRLKLNKELISLNAGNEVYDLKIEPIYDAYNYILTDPVHFEAFKVLSDRAIDMEKYSKSKLASKNYKYHVLTVYTDGLGNTDLTIDKVLEDLNSDTYFNQRKNIEKANTLAKRTEISRSIEQVNGLFERLGSENKVNDITMNAYPELADMLTAKEALLKQLNAVDVQLIEQEQVVYLATKMMNIPVRPFLPYFITLPFLFVVCYILIAYFNSKIKSFKA
ncbi:hypothetical protein MG290_09515 [Flavobacterium sp. CBA20B-1]|uniref:hypothetical protein n=1 Tax=unclassified Flavobacterium TaxID=196869 RepID=UPI002224C344|nr:MULTISPECIES: hypothetical protein [unclassified Flavobacterium]WCM41194.1 hypothetical protein MG290_09515 [Flavobacterium sp. CBA20B-1]